MLETEELELKADLDLITVSGRGEQKANGPEILLSHPNRGEKG